MLKGKLQQGDSRQKGNLHSRKSSMDTKTSTDNYADHTLGCRNELKYLISESKAQAIAQFIKPYIQLDRYCKLQKGDAYPIVSLYLDSDNLQLTRESMTGQKNRFKLRIRSYTDEPDYPLFFEIKRRMNRIIMKSRARVMQPDVPTVLAGTSQLPQNQIAGEETLKQFQLYMKSINAHPTILVRYMRQAYEGMSANRVRVTLDRELCYQATREQEIKLSGNGWQHHSYTLGNVILEIKFTARYPVWLSRMIKTFELRQRSISKFATSIEQACKLGFCAPYLRSTKNG